MTSIWQGLFPALWTPTDAAGQLLPELLSAQVRFLREAGVDGLMVLGSTGEFVHLDMAPRKALLTLVAETAPGWPIIANCSDVSPRRVVELGHHARSTGASAMSLMPPWFFALRPEDIIEFMVRCAEAVGLPLVLYNFPERTGHRLSPDVIAAICDRVPVVALKQSGGEFGYHRELAAVAGDRKFVLITGADTRIPEAFALGASGVVSGLANAVPEWVVASFRAAQRNDAGAMDRIATQLRAVVDLLGGLEFPVDVAAVMQARGLPTGELKTLLSPKTRECFERTIVECRAVLAREGVISAGSER